MGDTITVNGEKYEKVEDEMDMDMDAGAEAEGGDDMSMDMDEGGYGMMNAGAEEPTDDSEMANEDLELEAIIRELEEDLDEDVDITESDIYTESVNEEMADEKDETKNEEMDDKKDTMEEDFNIDEIIEEILSEEDEDMSKDEMPTEARKKPLNAADEDGKDEKPSDADLAEELTEAYDTIESLRDTINEVNLLNAKLLYTNKLFRNFELSENQKMTVIENFDRAGNTREVKLVFSTLAESFQLPVKKRAVVKESFASKATGTTAPSKEATKQIINEGNELANRWKKLAGLL